MNYEQYIPQFLKKPQVVAFPPLLPERWSNYPASQQILANDSQFYSDPTIGPTAKSNEFRKGVVSNWASDQTKYNPHFFTRFPFGSHLDGNFDNSTFEQTGYLQAMEGNRDLHDTPEPTAQDFEDADYKINAPAHLNAGLINNLIIPYTAGQALNRWDTAIQRQELVNIFPDIEPRAGLRGWLDEVITDYPSKFNKERELKRQRFINPRYLGDATDALGDFASVTTIDPTEIQLETIRRYRQAIDAQAGVDPDVPWNYKYQ